MRGVERNLALTLITSQPEKKDTSRHWHVRQTRNGGQSPISFVTSRVDEIVVLNWDLTPIARIIGRAAKISLLLIHSGRLKTRHLAQYRAG